MFGILKQRPVCCFTGFLFFSAAFSVTTVQAKDIEKGASIEVAVDFSDNINLTDTDEISDAVLRIIPGISFNKEGARVKSNLNYYLSGLMYARETDKNTVRQYLNANIDSELVDNSVYLDLNASISQHLLNPNRGASNDGVSGSDNLTQTYIYGLTPYWKKNWSNWLESEVRYNYNEIIFDNKFVDDSKQQSINLKFDSSRKFNDIFWGIEFEHVETNYETLQDTSADITILTLGYHYSRKLDLVLNTGYEDYDTPQSTRNSGGSGVTVGFKWRPNTRNSLDFNFGNRFFGNTYHLDYKRRARKITWNVTYADDITDLRNQTRQNVSFIEEDPDGVVVPESSTAARQGQYYLSRRLTNNLIYAYKKSTISWRLYAEKRFYDVSEQENEKRLGTSLGWQYLLSQRTTMETGIYWDFYDNIFSVVGDNEIDAGAGKRTRTTFLWSMNHLLTPYTSAFLRLRIQNNDADRSINNYQENRISVGLKKAF